MENRLVYFASPTEQQENAEVAKTEKAPDGLSKTADDLAQLEKLRAKPGGTKAAAEARSLLENPNVTEVAKKVLQQKIIAVEAAAAGRKTGELTPQKTETLDKKTDALKNSVEAQKKELSAKAVANSKFERLAALPKANETFRDVKVSINSKTHANTLTGFLAREDFRNLSLVQKNKYLDALYDKLGGNPDATSQILENFSKDKKLPKKWQEYAKNPEKYGHTCEHAKDWLSNNADKKILQAETAFKFLEGSSHLLEKAGIKMPSRDEVFEKSTSEFNQYFEGLKQKIATVDEETAARMDSLKVSEGAEIKTTQVEMKTSGEKQEKAEGEQFGKLAKKIQDSPIRKNLMEKLQTKKEEAKKDTSSGEADKVASLRSGEAQQQSGFFKNMLSKFGGKKSEEGDEEEDAQIHEQAGKAVVDDLIGAEGGEADQNENLKLSDSQRKQIVEMLGFKELPKGKEWENPLGVLMMKDADAKSVEDAMKKNREWWKGKTELFG